MDNWLIVHAEHGKNSSNNLLFLRECERLKQLFTNNNFPFKLINEIITTFITNKRTTESPDTTSVPKEKINIFYENQMNQQYKKDEKILKYIIKKNVKPANNTQEINTIIYYTNLIVNNLIM